MDKKIALFITKLIIDSRSRKQINCFFTRGYMHFVFLLLRRVIEEAPWGGRLRRFILVPTSSFGVAHCVCGGGGLWIKFPSVNFGSNGRLLWNFRTCFWWNSEPNVKKWNQVLEKCIWAEKFDTSTQNKI